MDDNWESIGLKSKDKARNNLDQNIKVWKFIEILGHDYVMIILFSKSE